MMTNSNEHVKVNPDCKAISESFESLEMNRIDLDDEIERFAKQCFKFFGAAAAFVCVMALLAITCIVEGC